MVYIKFRPGFSDMLSAESVSVLFADYGDFFVQKDTCDAWFIEVHHLESLTIEKFLEKIRVNSDVVSVCMYKDAPKFVAHQERDYI